MNRYLGMCRNVFACTLVLSLTLFGNSAAEAAFVVLDDFEGLTLGPLDTQNGWTGQNPRVAVAVDPADPSNQVYENSNDVGLGAGYKAFPTPIADGSTGTMFFRFRTSSVFMNSNQGASHKAVADIGPAWPDFKNQIQLIGSPNIKVRSGNFFIDTLSDYAPNTWYKMWIVSDNSTDTWELHIEGGAFATQTQLGGTWNYGNGPIASDILSFYQRNGGDANFGTAIWMDDIYVDAAGENLSNPIPNPIPEPSTFALLGLGLAAVAWRRCFQDD